MTRSITLALLTLPAMFAASPVMAQQAATSAPRAAAAERQIAALDPDLDKLGLAPECLQALNGAYQYYLRNRSGATEGDGAYFLATYAVLRCPVEAYKAFWPKVVGAGAEIDKAGLAAP